MFAGLDSTWLFSTCRLVWCKSHSHSDWNSRMLVELFSLERSIREKIAPTKNLRLFVANQTFFCLRKGQSQKWIFFKFCKIVDCGFSQKQLKRGSNHGLNLVQGSKTQTWIKILIQNETQTWTFDFCFRCRWKRKIFVVSILIKILRIKKREVLHVFDFSKIQTQT